MRVLTWLVQTRGSGPLLCSTGFNNCHHPVPTPPSTTKPRSSLKLFPANFNLYTPISTPTTHFSISSLYYWMLHATPHKQRYKATVLYPQQHQMYVLSYLIAITVWLLKSSTVNSVIGERVVAVSAFQSEGPRPVMVSRSWAGFTLNIIDTPGLVEGGYVNDRALHMIKSFLLNRTIDILLYVDRLDCYRVDILDRQIIKAITDGFGKAIWDRAAVVLSHAQLSPPDGLSYEEFVAKRSEALLKVVRQGACIKKQDTLV